MLRIHVYALAKIRQFKLKRPVERLSWTMEVPMLADVSGAYSAISSVLAMCDWAPLTGAFVTPFGYT